jgi:hypothetical protein
MTISFNSLGSHGRLGNQMFQYAALKSIATEHDYDFNIPPSNFEDQWYDHQLFKVFKLNSLSERQIKKNCSNEILSEKCFHFDQDLYENCPDNVDLFGYFQSEKYFKKNSGQIKNDFAFKEEIVSLAMDFLNTIKSKEVASVHVRRGDYVGKPWHDCCTLEYYKEALSLIDKSIPVILFSDDPNWIMRQDIFDHDRFLVSENNDNAFDLCLMTFCDYHIIANSSFSWWGAWLSNSKKVIAPKKWFGPPLDIKNDTKDLFPEEWLVI